MQVIGASQVTEISNKTEQRTQKMILNQKKYMQNAKLEFIYLGKLGKCLQHKNIKQPTCKEK